MSDITDAGHECEVTAYREDDGRRSPNCPRRVWRNNRASAANVRLVIDEADIELTVWRDPPETVSEKHAAIRLTHKPTGIVVESSEHDSQIANRDAAMRELERRVREARAAPSIARRLRRLFRDID